MDCFENYEKWAEQFGIDDEVLQKLHREFLEAESDFKKTAQKVKYGDPATVDLVVSLANLNCSRSNFSTAAILMQVERICAKILYELTKIEDAQIKMQDSQDKQQKYLEQK